MRAAEHPNIAIRPIRVAAVRARRSGKPHLRELREDPRGGASLTSVSHLSHLRECGSDERARVRERRSFRGGSLARARRPRRASREFPATSGAASVHGVLGAAARAAATAAAAQGVIIASTAAAAEAVALSFAPVPAAKSGRGCGEQREERARDLVAIHAREAGEVRRAARPRVVERGANRREAREGLPRAGGRNTPGTRTPRSKSASTSVATGAGTPEETTPREAIRARGQTPSAPTYRRQSEKVPPTFEVQDEDGVHGPRMAATEAVRDPATAPSGASAPRDSAASGRPGRLPGDTTDTPPPSAARAMPELTARACARRAASAMDPAADAPGRGVEIARESRRIALRPGLADPVAIGNRLAPVVAADAADATPDAKPDAELDAKPDAVTEPVAPAAADAAPASAAGPRRPRLARTRRLRFHLLAR